MSGVVKEGWLSLPTLWEVIAEGESGRNELLRGHIIAIGGTVSGAKSSANPAKFNTCHLTPCPEQLRRTGDSLAALQVSAAPRTQCGHYTISEGCVLYVARLTVTRTTAQTREPGTAEPSPHGFPIKSQPILTTKPETILAIIPALVAFLQ